MKKIISFCLMAALVMFSAGNVFAADESSDGTALQNETISLLNDLEIFRNVKQEDAESNVTRADFAVLIARVMGADPSGSGRRIFKDVLPEHEASASIEYLYDRGVMQGYGGAEFRPDETISVEEAVKAAVSVIGYSQKAEWDGGWSTGYYSAARQSDLLIGVNGSPEAALTIADSAALIKNILENDSFLTIVGYEDGEPMLEKTKNSLYMERVLGIYKYTGVAEAYDHTSLEGDDRDYEDTVKIGGEEFKDGGIDISGFFGMKVDAYYRLNKQTLSELLHVTVRDDNRVYTANHDDISEETTKNKLVSYVNDREKTFNISQSAQYIYNGKRLAAAADGDLIPDYGSVTLISNDGDSVYDVVIIKDYVNMVAEKVLAADSTVRFKYNKGSLDFTEGGELVSRFYENGKKAEFSSIAAGSVLSIALSKNVSGDKLAEVLISNNKISGAAKRVTVSHGVKKIMLDDDSEYELSKDYEMRLESGDANTYEPKAGEEGDFYIDYFGRIAAFVKSAASKNYAYVIAAAKAQSSFSTGVTLKLFTKEGNIELFDTSEKLILNDNRISPKDLTDRLMLSSPDGTVNQLIIYKTNSDNLITEITTAENKTPEAIGQDYYIASEDEFVLNYTKTGGQRFYKNMAEHLPFTYVDGTTLQFMVPTNKSNDKDYHIVTKPTSTDVTIPGPIYIYDAGASGRIGAMVTGASNSGSYSDSCLINEVLSIVDEEGVPCNAFEFAGGQTMSVASDATLVRDTWRAESSFNYWDDTNGNTKLTIQDLRCGDIIKYTTLDGKIDKIKIVVRADDIGPLRMDGDHMQRSGNMVADVLSVAEGGRTAMVRYYGNERNNAGYRNQTMLVNGTVYRYDSSEDKVYNSSTADLKPGDRILLNSFWWSPRILVIYR